MAGRDIIVVGASAGGVEALSRLVADLPEDLPAAVFIVLHISPHSGTALPCILDRRTKLPVGHPYNGERIELGRVYVAVPDHHLIVGPGVVRVANGPKENGHRPSVDTLFRSAAASYGPRVVGVVLSGTRDDGTAGLRVIRARGGVAIVQHPAEALFPGMPLSAVAGDHPDWVVPVGEIGSHLSELAHTGLPDEGGATFDDAGLPRYRCRVGHGFSADSLIATQRDDVEAALRTAYRALEERAALFRRLAERATGRHADITAAHFRADGAEVTRQAEILRAVLSSRQARGNPQAAESLVIGDESGEEPGP